MMYNQTLTLVEKSIENALRGCLLVAAFSVIFSSDKMLTQLVHYLASYHYFKYLGVLFLVEASSVVGQPMLLQLPD